MTAHHIAVLHGPNLNLLGTRESTIYGTTTLAEIDGALHERAQARGATVEIYQSNGEGELVDRIQQLAVRAQGIVINAGGYTHTSVSIRDALSAVALPAIEVHLSNLHKREPFRRRSLLAGVCVGVIAGFGARSYYLALDGMLDLLDERTQKAHSP